MLLCLLLFLSLFVHMIFAGHWESKGGKSFSVRKKYPVSLTHAQLADVLPAFDSKINESLGISSWYQHRKVSTPQKAKNREKKAKRKTIFLLILSSFLSPVSLSLHITACSYLQMLTQQSS